MGAMSESRPLPPSPSLRPLGSPASAVRPPGSAAPPAPAKIAPLPAQPTKADEADTAPMSLVDSPSAEGGGVSKIKAFGIAGGGAHRDKFARKPNAPGTGICRVRSFHGRLSDEGLNFIDDKINEWLDQHPEIEVKFVTSNIGVFEGKIRDPALILNVWY
jgi:hypothetical protein